MNGSNVNNNRKGSNDSNNDGNDKKFDPKKSHGVGDKIMMLIRIIMKKNLILKSLI